MRKILGVLLMLIPLFCGSAFGEVKTIDAPKIIHKSFGSAHLFTQTICVDGYLVVVVYGRGHVNQGGIGVSISQVYEERDGIVAPKKCK